MLGLDLGLSRDRTALCLLRVDALTGLVVVELLLTWAPPPGTKVDLTEVERAVAELSRTWSAPIVVDPWQGVLMAQRLRAQGCAVSEYTFTSENRRKLFGSLLDLIRTDRLRSQPHDELRRELLGLDVQQTSGGGWRVDHKSGRHDDHVIALALALGGFWDAPGDAEAELVHAGEVPEGELAQDNFLSGW
jgi:hypothetical protein